MSEIQNPKKYDLEDRCLVFARKVRDYTKKLPKTTPNFEYGKQLIRSSGSVGANYIEANESLSRKDFFMRIKISRKEAKESEYWLSLAEPNTEEISVRNDLIQEAVEFIKMFGSILEKAKAVNV